MKPRACAVVGEVGAWSLGGYFLTPGSRRGTLWGWGLFRLETLTMGGSGGVGCAVAARGSGSGPGRGFQPLGVGDWLVSAGMSSLLSISHSPSFPYNAGFRGDPQGGVSVCV